MAVKFRLDETSLDAAYNVTVTGVYLEGTTQLGGTRVFSFDAETLTVADMQDIVSAAQPIDNPADAAKKAAALTALAQLDTYIGTQINLDPPVPPTA